jgi:hypothetical protein
MSLTKLSLGRNNFIIWFNKIIPDQEELDSDIPAGEGKIANLFSQSKGSLLFDVKVQEVRHW